MKFRTKDLENYFSQKVDWKKIAQELTLKSFETVYYDGILEIDILPNRYADASSLIGLVKEIEVITNLKTKSKPKKITVRGDAPNKIIKNDFVKVDSKLAPYYFGRVILNINNKSSPNWLKEFVEFYGFNSVNFLVDLANFVMIEYGAPLHIFDLDKIKGNIFVRLAKKGEKFISLEGKEYNLQGDDIVIADKEKILGLAGIKGSKAVEINLETKNIFIEAAVFDPVKIYQSSRKLNLKTEASFRFERKVAPIRALQALDRVSYLINKNLGGEVLNKIFGEKNLREAKIKFTFEKIKKFTSLEINKNEILKIFKRLGIKVKDSQLIIPLDRLDLQTEEDIIEEIIRIYDLNKIRPIYELPLREIFIDENLTFNNLLRKILTKAGYNEGHNYSFYGEKENKLMQNFMDISGTNEKRDRINIDRYGINGKTFFLSDSSMSSQFVPYVVEILNPVSENYKYFQSSLIPNLLKSIYFNQFNFKEIKIFEISKIAYLISAQNKSESKKDIRLNHFDNSRKSVIEKYHLGIVHGAKNPEEILKELKGVLNLIASELGLNLVLEEVVNELFTVGVKIKNIGVFGLIRKKILEKLGIDLNVGVIELNVKVLKEKSRLKKVFKAWPIFPQVVRDLSFFVDENIKFSQIKKEIKKIKINYLQKLELTDIYFKEGKKSMTVRFIFSHSKRSLTDEEVNLEVKKIEEYLKNKFKISTR